MKKTILIAIITISIILASCTNQDITGAAIGIQQVQDRLVTSNPINIQVNPSDYWRSSLYPENWEPGYTNEHGDFLHDFSYAGYHMGEKSIPSNPPGSIVDVTQPPYNADNTGQTDVTSVIQSAINDVGGNGGGVVYLPEGKYRVSPGNNDESLLISYSSVVLRGDGPDKTFIFNNDYYMRSKAVIRVQPQGQTSWHWHSVLPGSERALIEDAGEGDFEVVLSSTQGINVGDWIVLTHDMTEDFINELGRPELVDSWAGIIDGVTFYRQVTSVSGNTITVDIPLRYFLKTRDNARIYKTNKHIEEVGVEHLSIGMRQHPGSGFGPNDYNVEGTAAYDVHNSYMLMYRNVLNGWVNNVHSYRPSVNAGNFHSVSNGLYFAFSRSITVNGTDIRRAQYRGGGGNGYAHRIECNDCLVKNSRGGEALEGGRDVRYAFDIARQFASGNVIYNSDSYGYSDFHMHLSVSNLIDNVHMRRQPFLVNYRGSAGTIPHGVTTDQSVFWNHKSSGGVSELYCEECSIFVNGQSDKIFVIGTSGNRPLVNGVLSRNRHRFEGIGEGETLLPQSLYIDQLQKRLS